MVEFFCESLGGCLITKNGWVHSYGTRCVKPPIIYGNVKYINNITVKWIKYAISLTKIFERNSYRTCNYIKMVFY